MSSFEQINAAGDDDARTMLTRCCAAQRWVDGMLARRPFADDGALQAAAEDVFRMLERDDWLEAFAAHPQIGDVNTLRAKYQNTRGWSESEQSGVDAAPEQVLERLAAANKEYLERFGYIFIVCATGKSAAEMLDLLEARRENDADEELGIAAAEQAKITKLRLEKLA